MKTILVGLLLCSLSLLVPVNGARAGSAKSMLDTVESAVSNLESIESDLRDLRYADDDDDESTFHHKAQELGFATKKMRSTAISLLIDSAAPEDVSRVMSALKILEPGMFAQPPPAAPRDAPQNSKRR